MNERYAEGLGRMVRCATVSHKNRHDDAEFAKLRAVVAELFPLLHEKSERTVFGDDCWLYRLPGRDSSRRILLMNHHDVVPAEDGEEWVHPPFSGVVADGAVWGRGTVDTKGPLYAELQAVEELLAEGWTPPCDLWLLSSHNEETAGDGAPKAAAWCVDEGVSFELVLDEGGAIIAPPLPGISKKCAMVAVHEKGRCRIRCRAYDQTSGTFSAKKRESALVRMSRFILSEQDEPSFPKDLFPEVRAMFTALAPHMRWPLRLLFSHPDLIKPILLRQMPKMNPQAGAMLGTQCTFTKIECNPEDHSCIAEASVRCVRHDDLTVELLIFQVPGATLGIWVDVLEDEYHEPTDPNGPEFAYLRECVSAVFPDVACAPYLLTAGTDGRHFCALSPAVLRFAPIDLTPAQFASVHGKNENLNVAALEKAVDFYRLLLKNYR